MNTLPPCDHDQCPPSQCVQPKVEAKSLGQIAYEMFMTNFGDDLTWADAPEHLKGWWEDAAQAVAKAVREHDALLAQPSDAIEKALEAARPDPECPNP